MESLTARLQAATRPILQIPGGGAEASPGDPNTQLCWEPESGSHEDRGGADAQEPGEGRGTCRSSAARESGLLKQPQGLLHHLLCSPPRLSQKHLVLVLLELAYRFLEMMVPGGEGGPQTSLMSLHPVSAGDTAVIPGTLAQAVAHETQAT